MADYVDVIAQGTREDTIITRTVTAHDQPTIVGALADLKGFTVISDGDTGTFRARCLNNATNGFRFLDCEFFPQNTAVNAEAVDNTANMEGHRTPIDILAAATEALNLHGGVSYLEDVDLGGNTYSLNMHAPATTLHIHKGSMTSDIITAGGVIQTLTIDYCDLNGATFTLGATGACIYWFERNTGAGPITDASLLGAGTIHYMDVAGAGLTKNGTSPWTIWTSYLTSVNNANAVGAINIYGGQLHGCGGSVGVVLWLIPALREYKVLEGMQIADALAAMAAGDIIRIGPGTFALAAQLARAIDDVTIRGVGLGTRITLDGVTAVITAGTQDGWILKDFDVDAGLVDIAAATNSTLHNITVNGLHGTVTGPDLGLTTFPGQPVVRLEEIRPLDPAATEIIKQYGRMEHQLYNPTFATPNFIMELLNRQARIQHIPTNAAWSETINGGASKTMEPTRMLLSTAAAGVSDVIAHCGAYFLCIGTVQNQVDFDNELIFSFDVSRDIANANVLGRVQLKAANALGILAQEGLGMEIQNYDILFEQHNGGRTVSGAAIYTLTDTDPARVLIWHVPGVADYYFINGVLVETLTTNVPAGVGGAACYWAMSLNNNGVATLCHMNVSPILVWSHF
jgi:hypothetical protein